MAYSKTEWVDGAAPALDAVHLNNIEDGLESVHTTADSLATTSTTHTQQIAQNASDIVTLDSSLDALAIAQETLHTAKYTTITNFTTTSTTYTDVINTSFTGLPSAVYKLSMSMKHNFPSTTEAALFRFSLDGGTTWEYMRAESKDIADIYFNAYFRVFSNTTGTQPIQIQAAITAGTDTLTVYDMTVVLEYLAEA